jgi:RNA-directed DNA polymerase
MSIRPRTKASDGRRQRAPYQWIIEGDIKGCFDQIDHHLLMKCVRARVGDLKVTRLVRQFLKAGVLEEGFLLPTSTGTPQGGVISPLVPPENPTGVTRGWAYGKEAADGRVFDQAVASYAVAVHAASAA